MDTPRTRTHVDIDSRALRNHFTSHSSVSTDDAISRDDERAARLGAIPLKFIRFTTIRERTGLSRSTIWRLERRGAFPKHHRTSANTVGWLEREVNDWVLSKLQDG